MTPSADSYIQATDTDPAVQARQQVETENHRLLAGLPERLALLPGADLPTLVAERTTLLEGGRLDDPDTIDVRPAPHGQRHPRIFGRYARLAPGEAFTLVNNHDPKPLHREFEATHPGAYTWDHLESGPRAVAGAHRTDSRP